jgi:6-pyruvoyltetrahydropterin/6-carboxytetrahydropterin synthase
MFTLKKQFRFEAAHVLLGHDGKCARLHGHSWVGRVIIGGVGLINNGPKTGMLADFGDIKKLLDPLVDEYLDHHFLNETLEMDQPTSEAVAEWLYDQLRPLFAPNITKFPMAHLIAVEIDETCTSSCRYGEKEPA